MIITHEKSACLFVRSHVKSIYGGKGLKSVKECFKEVRGCVYFWMCGCDCDVVCIKSYGQFSVSPICSDL